MAERGVDVQILDVRERDEVEVSMIEGATNIPMAELADRIDEVDDLRPVVVVCRVGIRSARVAQMLLEKGYDAINLKGGMQAFAADIDPTIPVA